MSIMGVMRNFTLIFGMAVLTAFPAVSALAFREPASLTSSSSGGAVAVVVLILVIALIVGVSMMSPRRTHQD